MSENTKNSDYLSDLLRQLRFSARVFFRDAYCGLWAVDTSGTRQVPFHLVSQGEGWLHGETGEPRRLLAGQLVMFPNDSTHVLAATSDKPNPAHINAGPPERLTGDITRLVCGYFEFERASAAPLLASLPPVLVLDLNETRSPGARDVVSLWMREAAGDTLGSDLAVDRLAELVFIEALRTQIATGQLAGIVGALADRRLGPALAAIHRDPQLPHTLEALAATAGMSKTAFAQRFEKQTGFTPGQYVRHWRLQQAARALRETDRSITAIAESVGYQSEVAFRKAFRAHSGVPPGRYRRQDGEL
ncbi:MAG: AraC family transcriptional regulator [Pseudomonadota bacterium]